MTLFIVLIVIVLVIGVIFYMNQQRSAADPGSYDKATTSTITSDSTNRAQARTYDSNPDAPTDVVGAGEVDGGGAKYNASDAMIGGISTNIQPEVSSGDDRPSYEKNN